jgi:streptogramin lyase
MSAKLAALLLLALALLSGTAAVAESAGLRGRVADPEGAPVVGAMVTLRRSEPFHDTTVFTDAAGRFELRGLVPGEPYQLRVRRIGWKEDWRPVPVAFAPGEMRDVAIGLERETDPLRVAEQLPASRWYGLVVDALEEPAQREELVRQCTYCHQQGSRATRVLRDEAEWRKVLALMARMGGVLSSDLRERLPSLFNEAYAPGHAVPRLTRDMTEPGFAPPPPSRVRRAVVEEWELGMRASMQHDLAVHPDGRIYSVDMMQDQLYRLDPATGRRDAFTFPRGDLPPGGVFGGPNDPSPPNANAHVGPHSLQIAPDGAVWSTLAFGNQLARFDPVSESFETHPLEEGYYPHTLRFDARGRVWYTVAGSNHVGRFDPATGEHRWIRLPARSFGQGLAMRMMPVFIWLSQRVDFGEAGAGSAEGMTAPVPYGIDVAPDGSVWFSQLNEHRIGRIDPETLDVEVLDTPFTAPRRLRFDARGRLWIPGFSSGLVARFDPATREFTEYRLPTLEGGAIDTPYALAVDRERDVVWICGTNSDTLIRFDPTEASEAPGRDGFTVYPLPTRVSYTREIDFDAQGRIWTSNSNLPSWQIEGGFPRVLRLDPDGTHEPGAGSREEERTAAR